MTASLALENVSKSFGPHQALDDLSFSVRPGEIVGLLGPNGSGKTTTLRLIAGFLAADRGTVRVGGVDIAADSTETRRRIGYLPERPPLYDVLTVTQYLEFVSAARGIPAVRRKREIQRVIDAYSLGEVRRKPVGRLSKGFRQRVGLAQATLGDPAVMLLDEATNGLDPLQIIEARGMILQNASGRAVVFSSHLMQEIMSICTRAIILYKGRMLADLPLDSLRGGQGGVRVRMRTAVPAATMRAQLASLDGVAAVDVLQDDGATLAMRCTALPAPAGADIADRIARHVCARGTLLAVEDAAPDLEQLFLDLTRDHDRNGLPPPAATRAVTSIPTH